MNIVKTEDVFYIVSVTFMHTFAMSLWGLTFFILYKFKIPFFERMRVNPVAHVYSYKILLFIFYLSRIKSGSGKETSLSGML